MNPLVSIVIITHNRLELLKGAIGTVLENTEGTWEMIVWDNGSTDGTGEYLDDVALEDERIHVVHHDRNLGLNALNRAFAEARGEMFVSMDDDVRAVPPGWLDRMLAAFRVVDDLGFLSTTVRGIAANPDGLGYSRVDHGQGVVLLERGPVGGWCFMMPRRVFEGAGGFLEVPELLYFYHDIDIVARIEEEGYRSGVLESVLVAHDKAPRTPAKERDRRRFGKLRGKLWQVPASWRIGRDESGEDKDGHSGE